MTKVGDRERLRRWRLALGSAGDAADAAWEPFVDERDRRLDAALRVVYPPGRSTPDKPSAQSPKGRRLSQRGLSKLTLALDEIAALVPEESAAVARRDAADRVDWSRLLGDEHAAAHLLARLEPDPAVAADLASLAVDAPPETKEAARSAIRRLLDAARIRLVSDLSQSLVDGRSRSSRPLSRPIGGAGPVDWTRSINAALARGAVVPSQDPTERGGRPIVVVDQFYRRAGRPPPRDLVILLDQSGSMRRSIGPAAVLAGALATVAQGLPSSAPRIDAQLFVFDDRLVDVTDWLDRPEALLFGAALGGGTDVAGALRGVFRTMRSPARTVVVLISDLGEPADHEGVLGAAAVLRNRGAALHVATDLTAARGRIGARTDASKRRLIASLQAIGAVCDAPSLAAFAAGVLDGLLKTPTAVGRR